MTKIPQRIIPRLDIKGKNLIKGINLEGLRVVGDPNKFAKNYYDQGADELIFMDNVASLYGRNNLYDVIHEATKNIFIPITVGGGIRSEKDAHKILRAGADKIAINTAAVKNPKIISDLSKIFGSQCIVISIEAKKISKDNWEVYTLNGREKTGINIKDWIKKITDNGAGEILLTSIDKDGTKKGFDIELVNMASELCKIPLIISGGCGDIKDIINLKKKKVNIQGIALGTVLHYGQVKISEAKKVVKEN